MTAVYTFRMIFRAFLGDPVPEARELEERPPAPRRRAAQPGDRRGGGHRRRLPRPRAPHRRAARSPMKIAMGVLALRRGRRRLPADPARHRGARPLPRADVRRVALLRGAAPVRRADVRRHGRSARCSALAGIARRVLDLGASGRAPRRALQRALRAAAHAVRQQVVRRRGARRRSSSGPSLWFGRFAQSTFERVVVNGAVRRRHRPALVRAGSAAVRARQTGFLRAYAALMLVGIAGVAPLLPDRGRRDAAPVLPALAAGGRSGCSRSCCAAPRRRLGRAARLARRARLRDRATSSTSRPAAGLQHVTDETWISELGIHYKLGVDGLNLFLVLLTTLLFIARDPVGALGGRPRARAPVLLLALARRTPRCSARCSRRTSRCSSRSST